MTHGRPNTRAQLICAWAGPVFTAMFFGGMLLARVVPPPAPSHSGQYIAHRIAEHRDSFRLGILIALASSGLFALFCAGLSVQLKRIEGRHSPMTYAQLGLGVLAVLEVIFPMMWLLTAAYRPERDPDTIRLLSDMAWFPFVGAWMTVVVQWFATAIAIFGDDSDDPILPRWSAYVCLWAAIQSLPSSLLFFVHQGPFAWNGILSYWLAASAFGGWIIVMTVLLLRAIRRQSAEAITA